MSNESEDLQEIVKQLNAKRSGCGQTTTSGDDDGKSKAEVELEKATDIILEQEDQLQRFLSQPLAFATILSDEKVVDPTTFEYNDRVLIIDKESEFLGRVGRICSKTPVIDEVSGTVRVEIHNANVKSHLRIGLKNLGEPQIKLLGKNDGTNITIAYENKLFEVWSPREFTGYKPGDTAKVNLGTNQIVEIIPSPMLGDCVEILKYNSSDHSAVITVNTQEKIIKLAPEIQDVNEGDKILVDKNCVIGIKKIEGSSKFSVDSTNVKWEDIGGQDKAKREIIEAIELPYRFGEIYKQYSQTPPKGILLYGPPGCGKTLLGKAAANSLAEIKKTQNVSTGFYYIKAPELLNPYVGMSESNVRSLFRNGRTHYDKFGYPCTVFVDEADSILMERGNELEKWRDTFVGMWLSEMDGLQENHMIIIFATNRQASMDGAILRDGRIDCHIHVPRPDEKAAMSILNVHLKNVPLVDVDPQEAAAVVLSDLFKPNKIMRKLVVNKESYNLSYKDCMNGAILAGIVRKAKQIAIRRDIEKGNFSGVLMEDLLASSEESYRSHLNLNLKFEIADFCDLHKLNPKEVKECHA